MEFLRKFNERIENIGNFLQDFFLLFIRLFWGFSFFLAGLPKLMDIERVISSFDKLGIPFPTLNAYLVGFFETVGGLFLMLGFCARVSSIPLSVIMIVALLTAHGTTSREAYAAFFNDKFTLFMSMANKVTREGPFTYLLTCFIVFCFGPGRISVDYLIQKISKKGSGKR